MGEVAKARFESVCCSSGAVSFDDPLPSQTNQIIPVLTKRSQDLASAAAAPPPMSHPSPGVLKEGRQAATRASGAGVGGPAASPLHLTSPAPLTTAVAAPAPERKRGAGTGRVGGGLLHTGE